MSATAPIRGAADTVPIEHETFDRVVRTLVFGIPPVALAVAGWLAWGGTLHWHDLLVLAITVGARWLEGRFIAGEGVPSVGR